jgi:hypothetical protein
MFLGFSRWSIFQKAGQLAMCIFEFFGDLSKSLLFVFCKLQSVLIREFGDLIW